MQKRSEGNNDHTEIGDIFQVIEDDDNDDEGNLEGSQYLGLDNNDITNKMDDTTVNPNKKIRNDNEGDDTSDCIEVSRESQNEGDIDRTATNSGKRQY